MAGFVHGQDVWVVDDDGKADFNTIQAAVDAASSGDEIQIMPGTYVETIRIPAISISLRGIGTPGEVILDGQDDIRLIEAVDLGGELLQLENLTLSNAGELGASVPENQGFALYAANGDCTLTNCQFVNSHISLGSSQLVTVTDGGQFAATGCVISGNTTDASNSHTGLFIYNMASMVIDGCAIEGNNLGNTRGRAPVWIGGCPGAIVRNSVFRNNACFDDGAAMTIRSATETPESDDAVIENCLFENNRDAYSCVVGALNVHGLFRNVEVDVIDCVFRDNPRSCISVKGQNATVRVADSIFCQNNALFTGCQNGSASQILDVGGNCFADVCDEDDDEVLDCIDGCPDDPNKSEPGDCGCGVPDTDANGNGLSDCLEIPVREWSTDEGGNGHWYELVWVGEQVTWDAANAAAEAAGGHLVSISSVQEDGFAFGLVLDIFDAVDWQFCGSYLCGPWLGGYRDEASEDPDLGWNWVDGSPWGEYTNWAPGEPDDHLGNQDFLHYRMNQNFPSPVWSDDRQIAPVQAYIVEWSADCNEDGIIDYGQVASGELADINSNGIPDECDWDIRVPEDFATIQAAIDAATEGDSIGVAAGDYPEAIDFGTKNLVLESIEGPESTFIGFYDATASIVTIGGGQTIATELRGFTIRRGYAGTTAPQNPSLLLGGGVYVKDSSPLVEDCILTDNKTGFGAGLYALYGAPVIRGCEFIDNYSTVDAGGLSLFISDAQVVDCLFDDNSALVEGGGVKVVLGNPSFVNCTIINNGASDGGGLYWFSDDTSSPLAVSGCTISNNTVSDAGRGGGIFARLQYAPVELTDTLVCDNTPDEIFGPYDDVSGNTLCVCPGDFNNDGEVSGADLGVMLALWGECTTEPCVPDLNGDGFVNGADLGLLLGYWGFCPEP